MNLKSIFILLLSVFVVTTFTGCGSEDSSSSDSTTSTQNTLDTSSPITSNLLDNKEATKNTITKIVDASWVKGLSYYCDEDKNLVKFTQEYGSFSCEELPMTLFIGGLSLGSVTTIASDNTLYTTDILSVPRGAAKNPEVAKLSILLQSLDEDGDLNNGIELSNQSISLLSNHISYDTKLKDLSLDDIIYMVEDVVEQRTQEDPNSLLRVVNIQDAQDNFTEMLASAPPIMR